MDVPGLASFRFTRTGSEIAAAVTIGAKQESVLDAYRRRVLPLALQVSGLEVLHASSVRSKAGIMALCGVSQVGKSTLAFGLNRRGYPLWGDDALAFETTDGCGLAISLPFEIRLRPSAAKLFGHPEIAASVTNGVDELPTRLETAPLATVCVLRRVDDASIPVVVRRLSFAEAFPTVFAHACWFSLYDPEAKRRVIDHYLDLVTKTPIFDVAFKPGLENLTATLDSIEEIVGQKI